MFSAISNMGGISQIYEVLWKALIRPPRAEYEKQDLGKKKVNEGPQQFRKNGIKIKRTNVQLTNKRGYKLFCSHYEPKQRPCKLLPCVIYLHANSSNQLEAYRCDYCSQCYLSQILCHDVTLFAFDFAGCGNSEGEYISLGYYEREDVDVVFKYLRSLETVSSIGIFGRSMGAVTALMYSDRNHEIGCLVLDSPFSNLQKLCKQLAKKHMNNVPGILLGIVLTKLSSTIKQKNQFKIQEISPIDNVSKAFIPALFIAAKDDDFVQPHHTDELYQKYSGEKQKILVQGGHNSRRSQQVLDKISSFFYFGLHVKQYVVKDPLFIAEQKQKKGKDYQKEKDNQKGKNKEREKEKQKEWMKEKEKEKEKEKKKEKEEDFDRQYQQRFDENEFDFNFQNEAILNQNEQLRIAIQESLKMIQNMDKEKEKEKNNEKEKNKEKGKKNQNGKQQKEKKNSRQK